MEVPIFSKLKRPLPWFLGLMAGGVILIGATTYVFVGSTNSQLEIEQLTVPVKEQNLRLRIKASGTVQAVKRIAVSPKTTGRLAQLQVRQGQRVKQGQLLAIMENDDIKAQGLQAQANLQQAVANIEEAKIRINGEIAQAQARLEQNQARLQESVESLPRKVQQAQEQVRAAMAQYQLAKSRVERNQNLVNEGAISQDRFQEVVTDFLNAKANLDEVQNRLEELQSTNNPEIKRLVATRDEANIAFQQRQRSAKQEVERLNAAAAAAQAQLVEVKERMEDTFLIAPFSGVVTQIGAEVGEIVAPTLGSASNSILTLAEVLEILVKVPEVDVGQLQVGQPVEVVADAYPDKTFRGRVKLISPEAVEDDAVTYFEVKVELIDGREYLKSKMKVDATFLGKPIVKALVVPTVTIVTKEGETGVMVTDELNKPKFKPVTLGPTVEDKTQILQGLEPGERVFIDIPEKFQKELEIGD